VPFAVEQLVGPEKLPGPDTIEKPIAVPSCAFTKPVPGFTFTCPVSVWFVPTAFVAVAGVICTFASTNVFTASVELPFVPSVCTLTGTPLIVSAADACPVTLPADGDVNVIVH